MPENVFWLKKHLHLPEHFQISSLGRLSNGVQSHNVGELGADLPHKAIDGLQIMVVLPVHAAPGRLFCGFSKYFQ